MDGTCLTCGRVGPLHAHHVAGRHNYPDLVVSVCLECHLILTGWQIASGIELHEDAQRSELDKTRALLVGMFHLIQLMAERHPNLSGMSSDLSRLAGRACSKLLDEAGAADRAGRWLPDPTYPQLRADEVTWIDETEDDRTREFGFLVAAVIDELGGLPAMSASRLRAIATRPADFRRAFALIARDHEATGRLALMLGDFVDQADRLVRRLLVLPEFEEVDASFVEEGAACLLTGWRVFTELLDLADDVLAREDREADDDA